MNEKWTTLLSFLLDVVSQTYAIIEVDQSEEFVVATCHLFLVQEPILTSMKMYMELKYGFGVSVQT